jgi:glucose/mannose-6-phosphate isomerase
LYLLKDKLVDFSKFKKYDSEKMYETYDKWPEIAEESFHSEQEKLNFANINHIVFAGMGGSGSIGDVFASILSKTNIHVSVVKGYLLPNTVDKNSLVVVTSISGNTIETLTILHTAKEKNCRIIATSSGGKMENYCKKNNIDFRKIKKNHSPRASFSGFLYSLIKILSSLIGITDNDVYQSINELKKTRELISTSNLTSSNPALQLAKWITGIPLIYYPAGLNAVAVRFKNSLQENSKLHVMVEDVIEACHNQIVSWEKISTVQPILLQGTDDYIKTKERWNIIQEYLELNNIDYKNIISIEGNILSKMMNLIYFLDYTSIYHAILNEKDPSPVNSINFVKERI